MLTRAWLSVVTWRLVTSRNSAMNTIMEIEHNMALRLMSTEAPSRIKAPDNSISHGEMSCCV